jgi:hypothetical protein
VGRSACDVLEAPTSCCVLADERNSRVTVETAIDDLPGEVPAPGPAPGDPASTPTTTAP